MKAGCLEESTVLAFLAGTLPPEGRSEVEEHIATCDECAELITWAAADQVDASRAPGPEGRPFVGQLPPGARVGRYQILGALGRGGMGEVYAAYHPDLDRRIALKVVQGRSYAAGQPRVRLLREARAIARLSHPNVVTVYDAGAFGDRVFIAMELIHGRTIDEWLRAAPRTWQRILDVFIGAGRGLAAAHAAGVIHRDFKPQNVMIGNDGSVSVMDFGLARLAERDVADVREAGTNDTTLPVEVATKTGTIIGTPRYMAPETRTRGQSNAQSDQFSFCVALYEALFGARPTSAGGASEPLAPRPTLPAGVPGSLRAVILRGASEDPAQRYPSMERLIAALEGGRTRFGRRVSMIAAGLVVLIAGAGAWRLARGNRFACAVPEQRVAAAWAANRPGDPRRESIHRAFAASGRAGAETSWDGLSKTLDEYVGGWNAMYVQACEATQVRGEQPREVLDLRMSCLDDNLEQVRALTDALVTADATIVSRAVMAAKDLTPMSRCGDVALLRSLMPPPRDERTLAEVKRLRRALAEVQTMQDLLDYRAVLRRSTELRPRIEATGYKPLLGELLNQIGIAEAHVSDDAAKAVATLREALSVAESSRDDVTAAKAAAALAFIAGDRLGQVQEGEFWAGFANSILDRVGGDQGRLRAWVAGSHAAIRRRIGDFEGASVLCERAVRLQEQSLGNEHPDVAISLGNLAYTLTYAGHPTEAVAAANRAVEIFLKYNAPDSYGLGSIYSNQGAALNALGRYAEAEQAFTNAVQILSKNAGALHPETAHALHGLGEIRLARGVPAAAVQMFERALRIRQQPQSDPVLAADTEFGLARALWDSGGDRAKARGLATMALAVYKDGRRTDREHAVETWLGRHGRR